MGAYARWRALSPEHRRLSMHACIGVSVAVIALRVLGVNRLLRLTSTSVGSRTKTVIGEMVASVDRAGRYVPGSTCLSRSLALTWLLRRNGVAAEVVIGVKTAGRFDAHAWVACDGVAVQPVPPDYAPMLTRS